MHSFRYREGHLYCEDVDLARVADELGTPTYVYSAGTILDHYARLDTALQSQPGQFSITTRGWILPFSLSIT